MNKLIQKINNLSLNLEKKWSLIGVSFIIGFLFLAFNMIYITPKFQAVGHGIQYSSLSNNPFNFNETFSLRYRILPSLIGYLTFLRGDLFFIIPLIFSFLLISSIYWVYRKKNYAPIDSLLFTGFITFSCTLYIQLQAPGYTDTVFYLFLFLSFSFIHNAYYSSIFFCLALFTHESSLFLLPGLLLYAKYNRDKQKANLIKHIIGYALSIIALLLFRYWISLNTKVDFDLSFYFSKRNIYDCIIMALPLFPAGAFYAFKLFWFFPLYVMYQALKNKEFSFLIIIVTILFFSFLQLIIAYDISRILCLAFPAILLSAEKLRTYWKPIQFTKFVLSLTIMNFFIIQYFISGQGLEPMLPLPYTLITELVKTILQFH